MTLRYPAEHEEGRCDTVFRQDIEQALGIGFDPPRQVFPLASVDRRGKSLDLEIVFDIDRHRIDCEQIVRSRINRSRCRITARGARFPQTHDRWSCRYRAAMAIA